MKTINVNYQRASTPIPVYKDAPRPSYVRQTGTILPMDLQNTVLRFHAYANGELRKATGVFADADEYSDWVGRHDPADEAERLL